MPTREAQAVREAQLTEQLLNARRTHLVRLVAVTFFFGLFVVLALVKQDASWSTDFSALAMWFFGSVLTVALAWRSRRAAKVLTLAPVFLDMPFIYVVQRSNFASTPAPSAVAGFSLGIYVLLLIISMLALSRWQVVLATVAGATFEVLLQREAGVSVGGMVSAVAVMAVAGFLVAYSGERMRRLLITTARAEKLAALGQLSAAVGHDLRNPLAAVTTALFVVRRRLDKGGAPLDDKVKEALDLAEREVKASQRIVGDLLDDARDQPLELTPTPLLPLIDEAVGLLRKRDDVQVRVDVPPSFPPVPLSRDRFRQVLMNLVQNACEAVPEGRPGLVQVRAALDANRVRVSVKDDGAGIDEATRARLFEPLFTTKKDGTGLGLSIVQSLVKQHGGTLTVTSAPGRGSEFIIELPAQGIAS